MAVDPGCVSKLARWVYTSVFSARMGTLLYTCSEMVDKKRDWVTPRLTGT